MFSLIKLLVLLHCTGAVANIEDTEVIPFLFILGIWKYISNIGELNSTPQN